MTKLSREEALLLIRGAWANVQKYNLGSFRFGQALWHLLPQHLVDKYVGTNNDFFFYHDSDKVIEVFYKYYVIEE